MTSRKNETRFFSFSFLFIFLNIFCQNVSFAQECDYVNVLPNDPNYIYKTCKSNGGAVRDVFLSDCPFSGHGIISPYGATINNGTIILAGDLIIDQDVTFKQCTFLLEENVAIRIGNEWWNPNNDHFKSILVANFEDCVFKGCNGSIWKGLEINGGGQNVEGPIVKITSSNFQNADKAIEIRSQLRYGLELEILETQLENNNIGLYFVRNPPRIKSIVDCTISNCNTGLFVEDYLNDLFNQTTRITFSGCETGMKIKNVQGINILNQTFDNCNSGIICEDLNGGKTSFIRNSTFDVINKGIFINRTKELASLIINGNTFSGYNNGRSVAIDIDKGKLCKINIINNPLIENFGKGINISNTSFTRFNISSHKFIENCDYGLHYLNNSNLADIKPTIKSNDFKEGSQVLMSTPYNINVQENELNASFFEMKAPRLMFLEKNISTNASIKVSNGNSTTFCCNDILGAGQRLYLLGTNAITTLNNTTFDQSNFLLEQSMIGTNTHTGNRWKGTTTGTLVGADPSKNTFFINLSEGNSGSGFMKPATVIPSLQENIWFRNDPIGSSNTCTPRCGLFRGGPIIPYEPLPIPDSIPDLGLCYPSDIDRDGDSVCDSNDPDPDNPCVPTMTDIDGDGICDSIDPDPSDPCNPIARDTDQDGVCDVVDPDPANPCKPNNQDSDGDGICNNLDINPNTLDPNNLNNTIYNDWVGQDSNGDDLNAFGYHPVGLQYSIDDLEAIAATGLGTTDYDELNYVESMTFLYEVLHSSPYYRILSSVLNNKYNQLVNSSIPRYYSVGKDINELDKPAHAVLDDLIIKELYLNRLTNVRNHLVDTIQQDSIFIINIDSIYEGKKQEIENILSTLSSIRQAKEVTLSSKITNLPTDYIIYSKLKDYYTVFASTELSKNSLSSNDLLTLTQIANLCPLIYGEAIHLAQAKLVSDGYNDFSDFVNSCTSPTLRSINSDNDSAEDWKLSMSPNPTSGHLIVSSNRGISNIKVISMQGSVLSTFVPDSSDTSTVDLSHLNPSMVIIEVESQDGDIKRNKIILIK